ncbi:MAG: bifunctional phosphopantothenoylcysteine decarboxylase/phosphopantothenate--cysteine ligase CoaBC, partial [Actinomycetota bacterium]
MDAIPGKRIVLGVCGGIAAYKAVEVARELTQAGADVRVVMTPSATQFVGPVTFSTLTGNPVFTELFPEPPPPEIAHTSLGRSADLILVAPATAKIIAKYALGISDDLLSSLLMATRAPVVMAPAMHTEMWENEATQINVATLEARGVRFVGPAEGALAGPDVGVGRLADPAQMFEAVQDELALTRDLEGVGVLVTAGGTQEPIDAVRFIGNPSSGKMGFEVAREAVRRGAKVTLVTGPSSLVPPDAAETVRVRTAAEMREAVQRAADTARVIVMTAAVSDWRPSSPTRGKIRKADGPPEMVLEPTVDILEELGRNKGDRILVGFAAETGDLEKAARAKLRSKSLDLIVANLV